MTDDILQAYTCFDNMARIFLFLKWSGAEKVRSVLKMSRKDPTYDPNANGRWLYIVLYYYIYYIVNLFTIYYILYIAIQ